MKVIVEEGTARVSSVDVITEADDVVVIEVDMGTKRCDISIGLADGEAIFYLEPSENTPEHAHTEGDPTVLRVFLPNVAEIVVDRQVARYAFKAALLKAGIVHERNAKRRTLWERPR